MICLPRLFEGNFLYCFVLFSLTFRKIRIEIHSPSNRSSFPDELPDRQRPDPEGGSIGDPTMRVFAERRSAVWHRHGVHQSHAAVRVSPVGVSGRRPVLQPTLPAPRVTRGSTHEGQQSRMGTRNTRRHQKGTSLVL